MSDSIGCGDRGRGKAAWWCGVGDPQAPMMTGPPSGRRLTERTRRRNRAITTTGDARQPARVPGRRTSKNVRLECCVSAQHGAIFSFGRAPAARPNRRHEGSAALCRHSGRSRARERPLSFLHPRAWFPPPTGVADTARRGVVQVTTGSPRAWKSETGHRPLWAHPRRARPGVAASRPTTTAIGSGITRRGVVSRSWETGAHLLLVKEKNRW